MVAPPNRIRSVGVPGSKCTTYQCSEAKHRRENDAQQLPRTQCESMRVNGQSILRSTYFQLKIECLFLCDFAWCLLLFFIFCSIRFNIFRCRVGYLEWAQRILVDALNQLTSFLSISLHPSRTFLFWMFNCAVLATKWILCEEVSCFETRRKTTSKKLT